MPPNTNLLGIGIYYPAEGARYLQVPAYSLRRWAQGYTYWDEDHSRRFRSGPVTRPDLPTIGRQRALSFLELMELRVVAKARGKGLSLQHVRQAAAVARKVFGIKHPFATRRVFTDRRRLFAYLDPLPGAEAMIALVPTQHVQLIFGSILEPTLEDLDFDDTSGFASRWWPLGRKRPIVLDPNICFGAPTIAGTRVRTDTAAGMASVDSLETTAVAFDLTRAQVDAAVEFENLRQAA